ncbi:Slc25a54 [Cordylochernes scorpioides]|uniref:Slc25a54 n=1 Tax=Cordylochernes scorpioides TaxID=51811 RepID=A0ABY6KBK1_9ARAC|nr:Slc25a54 [Cordylochernes scorpioides]
MTDQSDLSHIDVRSYREIFNKLDRDGDGRIAFKDFEDALRRMGVPFSSSNLKDILEKHDSDQSGTLEFEEFVQYMKEHDRKLMLVFRALDENKDGKCAGIIDTDEIIRAFEKIGSKVDRKEAFELLQRMDKDKSLSISFSEWRDYLMFHPTGELHEIISYWRHSTFVDIGEDSLVPDEFSEDELKTGVWWRHLVAGGVAGAVSRTVTAPMDRLKVFLQVKGFEAGSLVNCLRNMLREGGLPSLWRGNGINVIKIAPESALKFTFYEQVKQLIHAGHVEHGVRKELSIGERFVAGSMAGVLAQTAIYPMEVLKTRMALRRTGQYTSTLDAFVKIYRSEGLMAYTRGYIPNSLGIIPYAGIDLAIYETLKNLYLSRNDRNENPGVLVLLACGSISSSCGQLASYPLALIKTRLQAQTAKGKEETSMRILVRKILHKEGIAGLYRGICPNFLKVIPAVSISYVVYEHVRKALGDILEKHDSDQSGTLEFEEFVQYMKEHDRKLMLVFRALDENKDGKFGNDPPCAGIIDTDEIIRAFEKIGSKVDRKEAFELLQRMDKDKSLSISFSEWRDYLMFHPTGELHEIISYWRHSTFVDIGEDSLVPDEFSEDELKTGVWWRHLVAGGVAGAVSRTVTAPMDRLKVFLQVLYRMLLCYLCQVNQFLGLVCCLNQDPPRPLVYTHGQNLWKWKVFDVKGFEAGSLVNCLRNMLREGGLPSLWRGNGINVIKIAPESALKFTFYEQVKQLIHAGHVEHGVRKELSIGERFVAGSMAGVLAQTAIYPMEVLKTRMALRRTGQYTSTLDAFVKIYRSEGLMAYTRGYIPNSLGIIPYAGIDLAIYETLKNLYLSRNDRNENPGVLVLLACGSISSSCGQLASYPLALIKTRLQAQSECLDSLHLLTFV